MLGYITTCLCRDILPFVVRDLVITPRLMLLTIKAEIYLYVPSDLTVSKDAFCIYGFRMIFTVKSESFLKQH
jgi:hypothetical protein